MQIIRIDAPTASLALDAERLSIRCIGGETNSFMQAMSGTPLLPRLVITDMNQTLIWSHPDEAHVVSEMKRLRALIDTDGKSAPFVFDGGTVTCFGK